MHAISKPAACINIWTVCTEPGLWIRASHTAMAANLDIGSQFSGNELINEAHECIYLKAQKLFSDSPSLQVS